MLWSMGRKELDTTELDTTERLNNCCFSWIVRGVRFHNSTSVFPQYQGLR